MCVHPHTTLVALHHLLAIVEVDTAWTSHDPGLVSPIVGLRTRGMMCLPSHRTHPPRNNNDSHPLLLFSSNPHSTLHRSRCTAMHTRTHRSLLLLLNPNHRPSLSASLSSLARQQQRFANAEKCPKIWSAKARIKPNVGKNNKDRRLHDDVSRRFLRDDDTTDVAWGVSVRRGKCDDFFRSYFFTSSDCCASSDWFLHVLTTQHCCWKREDR